MKNKLIATLVAATLQFHAAAALAQQAGGQCELPNGAATTASGATPVSSGPLNPVDGFPEYLVDSNGVAVQRCLDAALCFFDPIEPADPFSLQIGSGGESFYWGADSIVTDAAGNAVVKLVMAAEAAIMQTDAAGMLVNGSQSAFLRQRYVMGVPVDGTYTVKHPYGVDVFTVVGATGARDVVSTLDKGFAPNSTFTGTVGAFLVADNAPDGYLGDNAGGSTVTGSPCGRNFVEVSGVDTLGQPVDFGGGVTVLRSDRFAIQGRRYDGRVQTPLNATRLTFSRATDGTGQIETFVESSATAAVTANDGPTTPANLARYHGATALDHAAVASGGGIDSLALPVVDAAAMPAIVQLSASDTATDTSTVNLPLVDFVNIDYAEYDPETGKLAVAARSGDALSSPKLTLRDFGDFAAGSNTLELQLAAPPAFVHVDSASGGTDKMAVQVLAPGAISAPLNVAFGTTSSQSMVVSWLDTTRAESGFKVYLTPAGGTRTLAATVGANVTSATLAGLEPSTSYEVVIEAFTPASTAASAAATQQTLALPAAPTAVAAALAAAQRTVNVSWAASADATGYQVYRRDGAAGAFNLVSGATPLAAGQVSFADGTAPVGNTATYQVVTVRDNLGAVENSAPAYAAELATPALPNAASALATSLDVQTITLNWTAGSGADAQQVYRQKDGGAFVAVGAPLAASATTFTDADLPGGNYVYRVDATNWAGATESSASAAVKVVVLRAPTTAAASMARQPVITWTDNSEGESGYRIRRRAYTVDATTGAMTAGAWSTLTAAAAVTGSGARGTYTDTTAAANITYRYEVAPLNGATAGAVDATGLTMSQTGGFSRMSGFTTVTASVVNNNGQVELVWPASTNGSVGGYEIFRCNSLVLAGTPTAACSGAQTKLGSAPVTGASVDGRSTTRFTDTTVARDTAYVYNIRVVGGAGTGNAFKGPQLVLGTLARVR